MSNTLFIWIEFCFQNLLRNIRFTFFKRYEDAVEYRDDQVGVIILNSEFTILLT
jgi:hypothetical protein